MKLEIEYIPITDVKPYERNAKIHTPEQIEQIKRSIQEFGMNDPIGIWGEDNLIVEGHGRLAACKELGYKEIPVIRLDGLTDEQRRAYTLVHNQTTMSTGFDIEVLNKELEALDMDMTEYGFDEISEPEIEIDEDEYEAPEPEEEPQSRKGEIYRLGDHVLMCGDSTSKEDVEALMEGVQADCVVTDPPYNVAYEGGTDEAMTIKNDDLTDADFRDFLGKAFENMARWLKPGGAFYVWYASRNHIAFETALNENGLEVREQLIWVKNTFVLGWQDYQWMHEPCMYGWKAGEGHYFIYDRTQPTAIEYPLDYDSLSREELVDMLRSLEPGTVFHVDKPPVNDIHPTMKPLTLIGKLVRNSTQPGETVLDLFGGGGSTLIACEELGRKCRMMELDPFYADAIINRWETHTGKKAVKIK